MPTNSSKGNAARVQQNGGVRPATGTAAAAAAAEWRVRASDGALNTSNPIREIIETMNLAENPAKKVIPLSIGDPTIFGNLKPCHAILDAIQRANASGKYYGYQTAAGMECARKAVARYHNRCTGGELVREQDVILASGCSHAIDLCICVLARHGQNILIPRPGFPLYKTLTSVYGVKFKQYNLLADKNWSIDLRHLESLIDADTAAIVINNPSNPCGSVFSKRHLLEILELAERHRLPIISDEIYDKFVFSPELYKIKSSPEAAAKAKAKAKRPTSDNRQACNGDSGHYETAQTPLASDNDDENNEDHENVPLETQTERRHCKQLGGTDAEVLSAEDSALEEEDEEEEEEEDDNDDDDGGEVGEEEEQEGAEEEGFEGDGRGSGCHGAVRQAVANFRHARFRSLASLSDTVPILTCGGISKTCLIPGLRLGWIIINDKKNIFDASIRHGLSRLTQRLMGPNSLVQGALHDILTNVPDDFYKQTMDFIFQNAKLCYERLLKVPGLNPYMPQGSMYLMVGFNPKLFPDIDGDLDLTSKLMNEQSVLVLPGKCFDFPNFFRICLTVPTIVMEDALTRIEEFCSDHAIVPTSDKEPIDPVRLNPKHNAIDTTKALKKQQPLSIMNPGAPKQNHIMQQNHQQTTTTTTTATAKLNKRPFEPTVTSKINGNQQIARSKCK